MRLRPLRQPSETGLGPGSAESFVEREIRLPASAAELRRVRSCVSDAAADFGFGPKDRFELVFAVNEAVTNAIQHGQPDDDGAIGLTITAEGDTLVCAVHDRGRFVAPSTVTDLLAEHGRGLEFMALLTDEIEVSTEKDATTVRLHKRRSSTSARRP